MADGVKSSLRKMPRANQQPREEEANQATLQKESRQPTIATTPHLGTPKEEERHGSNEQLRSRREGNRKKQLVAMSSSTMRSGGTVDGSDLVLTKVAPPIAKSVEEKKRTKSLPLFLSPTPCECCYSIIRLPNVLLASTFTLFCYNNTRTLDDNKYDRRIGLAAESALKSFLSGGVGGICVVLVGHPLDLIKVCTSLPRQLGLPSLSLCSDAVSTGFSVSSSVRRRFVCKPQEPAQESPRLRS